MDVSKIEIKRVSFLTYMLISGHILTLQKTLFSKLSPKNKAKAVYGYLMDFRNGNRNIKIFVPKFEDFTFLNKMFTTKMSKTGAELLAEGRKKPAASKTKAE